MGTSVGNGWRESSRTELWTVYSLHSQELAALIELLDDLVGFSHKHGLVNGQAEALRRSRLITNSKVATPRP
jgi:hypothetical protein